MSSKAEQSSRTLDYDEEDILRSEDDMDFEVLEDEQSLLNETQESQPSFQQAVIEIQDNFKGALHRKCDQYSWCNQPCHYHSNLVTTKAPGQSKEDLNDRKIHVAGKLPQQCTIAN